MKKLFGLLFVAGIIAMSACGSGAKDQAAANADSLAKATTTPDQADVLPSSIGDAVKFKLKLNLDQKLFLRDK